MFEKSIAGLLCGITLCGCVSFPNLQSATPTTVKDSLNEAAALQSDYAAGYKKSAIFQDYSQLPIIGAAANAAWILLKDKPNAAKRVGRVGIKAGAYSAVRGQLLPSGLAEIYIAGHGALTCVIVEGYYFSGDSADRSYAVLEQELQRIANQVAALMQAKNVALSATATAEQTANLKSAQTLADQAIAQAHLAETAALIQEAAYENAAPVFSAAVSSISARVASKGRQRPAVEFGSLRDSLGPAKPPSVGAAQGAGPVDPISRILELTSGLISTTARLTQATRNYSASLARVAACPDQVR
ncbi:MAG: hypothetical protein JWO33_553 [Caulobacteraceae bacterium]|nr:hypothetical protein [Caulobacteraceae bacterium]